MKKSSWSGGVKKLESGKWLARVTWTDKDGKRRDTERVVIAANKAEALLARIALQAELSGPRDYGWTVTNALERYVDTLRPGTKHSWGSYAKRIKAVFGERRLGTITSEEVRKFLYELPVSDGTRASIRTLFSCMYTYARDCGSYSGTNPVKDTRVKPKTKTPEQELEEQDNPVQRAYLGDERERFLAALDPDLRPLQITQYLLGCRFGEASALELRDVDLETGAVHIRQTQFHGKLGVTKAKKTRRTALGPYGLSVLKEHLARMVELKWPGWDRWVFPRPVYEQDRTHDMWAYFTVVTKVREAQKAAGITVASRTHAMRHTHITEAAASQVLALDEEFRKAVGHASEAQTRHYIDSRGIPVIRRAAALERALMGDKIRTGESTT